MVVYSTCTDEELMRLLQEGHADAFTAIYDRYWKQLCAAALKRLSSREQAEDIVQNIFIRLWTRRDKLMITHLSNYLLIAVRNGVLDYVTRQKVDDSFYAPFDAMLAENESPEASLLAKDLLQLIEAYAETLPAKRKKIFLLYIQHRLSTGEIAEMLDVSRKTVQNQLRTALSGLQPHILPVVLIMIITTCL